MSSALQDAISQTLTEQKACARAFNRYYYLSIAVILAIVPIGLYLDDVKVDTPLIKIAEILGTLIFFRSFGYFFFIVPVKKLKRKFATTNFIKRYSSAP